MIICVRIISTIQELPLHPSVPLLAFPIQGHWAGLPGPVAWRHGGGRVRRRRLLFDWRARVHAFPSVPLSAGCGGRRGRSRVSPPTASRLCRSRASGAPGARARSRARSLARLTPFCWAMRPQRARSRLRKRDRPGVPTGAWLFRASDLSEESPRDTASPPPPLTLLDTLQLSPAPRTQTQTSFGTGVCRSGSWSGRCVAPSGRHASGPRSPHLQR